jgi:hypothetical protein
MRFFCHSPADIVYAYRDGTAEAPRFWVIVDGRAQIPVDTVKGPSRIKNRSLLCRNISHNEIPFSNSGHCLSAAPIGYSHQRCQTKAISGTQSGPVDAGREGEMMWHGVK